MNARAYTTEPLAPWAEPVVGADPMGVDALLALPEDDWRYEVVEGMLVRMAGSGFEAADIAMRLGARLRVYAEDHDLGVGTGADGVYDLSGSGQKDTGLIPDVAFFIVARLPLVQPEKAIPFAPDLVVEVASPSQWRPELAAKVQRYLAAGTRLAWVIWPRQRQVDVWRASDRLAPTATLGPEDELDGEQVVPGFTFSIARLFR